VKRKKQEKRKKKKKKKKRKKDGKIAHLHIMAGYAVGAKLFNMASSEEMKEWNERRLGQE
jgi:hypothetical protein